jgi:hypothetical protein
VVLGHNDLKLAGAGSALRLRKQLKHQCTSLKTFSTTPGSRIRGKLVQITFASALTDSMSGHALGNASEDQFEHADNERRVLPSGSLRIMQTGKEPVRVEVEGEFANQKNSGRAVRPCKLSAFSPRRSFFPPRSVTQNLPTLPKLT